MAAGAGSRSTRWLIGISLIAAAVMWVVSGIVLSQSNEIQRLRDQIEVLSKSVPQPTVCPPPQPPPPEPECPLCRCPVVAPPPPVVAAPPSPAAIQTVASAWTNALTFIPPPQQPASPPRTGSNAAVRPFVLVLTIVKDEHSFGKGRTLQSYLDTISQLKYPRDRVSIGLLVSDAWLASTIKQTLSAQSKPTAGGGDSPYASITVVHRDSMDINGLGGSGVNVARDDGARHAPDIQKERRSLLARYRNLLLAHSLQPLHEYVLWLDSDITTVPPTLIDSFIESEALIATPRCNRAAHNYDLNAWAGPRLRPSAGEQDTIRRGGLFVPRPVYGVTQHMDQIAVPHSPPIRVALDSVGGTALWVHADVHRQGAVFPHFHVIGTDWDTDSPVAGSDGGGGGGGGRSQHSSRSGDGYDGIETEGLCFSAKRFGSGSLLTGACLSLCQTASKAAAAIPPAAGGGGGGAVTSTAGSAGGGESVTGLIRRLSCPVASAFGSAPVTSFAVWLSVRIPFITANVRKRKEAAALISIARTGSVLDSIIAEFAACESAINRLDLITSGRSFEAVAADAELRALIPFTVSTALSLDAARVRLTNLVRQQMTELRSSRHALFGMYELNAALATELEFEGARASASAKRDVASVELCLIQRLDAILNSSLPLGYFHSAHPLARTPPPAAVAAPATASAPPAAVSDSKTAALPAPAASAVASAAAAGGGSSASSSLTPPAHFDQFFALPSSAAAAPVTAPASAAAAATAGSGSGSAVAASTHTTPTDTPEKDRTAAASGSSGGGVRIPETQFAVAASPPTALSVRSSSLPLPKPDATKRLKPVVSLRQLAAVVPAAVVAATAAATTGEDAESVHSSLSQSILSPPQVVAPPTAAATAALTSATGVVPAVPASHSPQLTIPPNQPISDCTRRSLTDPTPAPRTTAAAPPSAATKAITAAAAGSSPYHHPPFIAVAESPAALLLAAAGRTAAAKLPVSAIASTDCAAHSNGSSDSFSSGESTVLQPQPNPPPVSGAAAAAAAACGASSLPPLEAGTAAEDCDSQSTIDAAAAAATAAVGTAPTVTAAAAIDTSAVVPPTPSPARRRRGAAAGTGRSKRKLASDVTATDESASQSHGAPAKQRRRRSAVAPTAVTPAAASARAS